MPKNLEWHHSGGEKKRRIIHATLSSLAARPRTWKHSFILFGFALRHFFFFSILNSAPVHFRAFLLSQSRNQPCLPSRWSEGLVAKKPRYQYLRAYCRGRAKSKNVQRFKSLIISSFVPPIENGKEREEKCLLRTETRREEETEVRR